MDKIDRSRYEAANANAHVLASILVIQHEEFKLALEQATHAETLGAIIGPTLWMKNGEKLRGDIETFRIVIEAGRKLIEAGVKKATK